MCMCVWMCVACGIVCVLLVARNNTHTYTVILHYLTTFPDKTSVIFVGISISLVVKLEITHLPRQNCIIFIMAAQVHEFSVEMTCEGCSTAVQNVLKKKAGVDYIKIDLPEQKVSVTTALNSDEILEAIKKTGKTCQFLGTKN